MVRIDPAESEAATEGAGVSPFRMRGRDLAGWLHVAPDAVRDDAGLRHWLDTGLDFARTLPPQHPA